MFRCIIIALLQVLTGINSPVKRLHEINLTKLPQTESTIKLSQIAQGIKYIPLETNNNCLIGPSPRFFLYDSIIVCCAHHQIILFNSKNGKFIRNIGAYGKGPDEFINSSGCYVKNDSLVICAKGWDLSLLEFNLNGKLIGRQKFHKTFDNIAWLKKDSYVLFYPKITNADRVQFEVIDAKTKRINSTFYDNRPFKDTNKFTFFGAEFYQFNNSLYVKEYFNDTIFQIDENRKVASIVFNSGKYSPPFYERETFDFTEYHSVRYILETNNLIFFKLNFKKETHFCYYDKRTRSVFITNHSKKENNGFENDIDGFVPFCHQTLNNKNELVGYVNPNQIRQWFNENPDKAAKLSPELKKLKNINANNNPVLMIVKLKK